MIFSAIPATSPRGGRVLLRERGQLELAEENDLVLQLDPVLLPGAPAGLRHQRDRIRRARLVGVLDEVRVARGDLGPADAVTLQAAGLEHAARAERVIGVLEDASVGALVRRLRCLPLLLQLRDQALDLVRRSRRQPELDLCDYLTRAQRGASIAKPQLVACVPEKAVDVGNEGAVEDRGPVAAVRTGVHAHSPARCPRDRAGELEAAEACRTRAV